MKLGGARYSLESAYTINKRTPASDMWEKPTTTIIKAKRKAVIYDNRRKGDRKTVVSTPEPAVHATETRGGISSTNGRVMDSLEAGKIIAAAEKISHGHTQWARFCYDPLHDKGCAVFLAKALFCAWAVSNRRYVKPSKVEMFQDLTAVSLIDTRHRILTGRPKFTANEICIMLGFGNSNNANWHRGLKGHFNLMYKIVDEMDRKILLEVSTAVSRMRD